MNKLGIRAMGKNAPRIVRPEIRCEVCGDVILGKPRYGAAPRKYCGQSCTAQAQRDRGFAALKEQMGVDS